MMKHPFTLIVLLMLASTGTLFAESSGRGYFAGLGVNYLAVNQDYTTSSGVENVTLAGVGLQSNFMTGRPFGILGSVTLAYVLNGTRAGVPLDMSVYSARLLFNMLFGFGYRLHVTQRLATVVGGGVNAVGALMVGPNYSSSLDLAYATGLGTMLQLDYELTPSFGVYLNGGGTYDPIAIINAQTVGFKSGFTYSFGAGIDLLY